MPAWHPRRAVAGTEAPSYPAVLGVVGSEGALAESCFRCNDAAVLVGVWGRLKKKRGAGALRYSYKELNEKAEATAKVNWKDALHNK